MNRPGNTFVAGISVILSLAACAEGGSEQPEAGPSKLIGAGQFTVADFERLRWVEGRWRGSGPTVQDFFEEYRFAGDTLILMKSSSDSIFADSTGGGRFFFSGGRIFYEGADMLWEVTGLDSRRLHFEPRRRAANSFRWLRESESTWRTTIAAPGGEQAYLMERIPN
jgi:hypothetical protein